MTRKQCKQRVLAILARLMEEGDPDSGNFDAIWNVNADDTECTDIAVDELITEFKRRAGKTGTGQFGEVE